MRNKIWTQEEVRAVISTAVVALLLVGLFFYGKMEVFNKEPDEGSSTVNQQLFITGTGLDLKNAFDNNINTAWFGEEGYYGKFNYVTIDFKQLEEIKDVSLILGNENGPPINYMVSIESSVNNAIWRDVVGGAETGFFDGKKEFIYNFIRNYKRFSYKI